MISNTNFRSNFETPQLLIVIILILSTSMLLFISSLAKAGTFIFAGEGNGIDIITHPSGYDGTGGELTIGVCIDSSSTNANEMVIPLENMVATFNKQQAHSPNIFSAANNSIPNNAIDFESVALHELGHCLSLSHVNAATESGLSGSNRNYTKATNGVNNVFDLDAGTDGVIGSEDDIRPDDVNLHWFNRTTNNPCAIDNSVVDITTYSRDTANLPGSDSFATNADRDVCALLGFPNTEAVMQQGSFFDEDQRRLAQDDISTLKLGMSGLDEMTGTADDYTLNLVSLGLIDDPSTDPACDIIADFDNTETGFAVCQTSGSSIGNHVRVTSANMFFNTLPNWHFNDVRDSDIFCGGGPLIEDTDIVLGTDPIVDDRRFIATQSIISGNTLNASGCLSLSAGTKISFAPGFTIKSGATFKAGIE